MIFCLRRTRKITEGPRSCRFAPPRLSVLPYGNVPCSWRWRLGAPFVYVAPLQTAGDGRWTKGFFCSL